MVLAKDEESGMTLNTLFRRPLARWILLAVLALPGKAFADSSALILSSVPGDDEHAEKFLKWAETTRMLLVDKFGFAKDHVITLSDEKTRKADIDQAFDQFRTQLKPADTFFLFFIGHGSYDTDYKFNILGPDLTGVEYSQMLSTLKVGRIVIVNGTSCSGGSLDTMKGKNRVIITATKSGREANETLFYEHFLDALQNPAADEDKDQKISVWEAFKYATDSVDRFYKEQGRIATEHPQLSDNGGEMVDTKVKDPPVLARVTDFQVDRPVVVSDPKLQTLLNEKREIDQKIEALRISRDSMSPEEYDKQMEDLLVKLATKNQEIKAQESKKP
jgi:hypothetical protein